MKKYMLRKRIFAVVFIVTVFGFSVLNFWYSYPFLLESMEDTEEISVEELDEAITENLYGRMDFIESYGYVQRLLDKRECNNFSYIKDEAGFLHYASFYREDDAQLFEYAMRVKRMQDYVEKKGTKVLFVVPPGKYDKDFTELRTGLPVNNPDNIVDTMMFYLNRLGVETLNLGESMPNEELPYEETFFRTDHHWTIPAAFYATGEIVDKMGESFGEDLDPENYYTDINNYDAVTYQSGMLGSMGRKTGVNFSGVEDFTALWPKFTGDFTWEYLNLSGKSGSSEGSFVEAFMETDVLTEKEDIYSDSQYSLYLDQLNNYEKLINKDNPDGVKIFMVRDSYFAPVMAFMAPMCGEIDAIWSLEEMEELDIESYVKENEFDYIIVEIYPYNLNDKAFNFFKEGDEAA